jgi:hypothetical protein
LSGAVHALGVKETTQRDIAMLLLRHLSTLLFICPLLLTSSVGAQPPTTAASTNAQAQSRGTQIGSVITGAINAALPGVGSLAQAVMNLFTAHPNPQQTAAAQKASTDAEKTLKDKIAAEIKDIAPLEAQLNTLGPFIQYGSRANARLSALIEYVSINTTLTDDQWHKTVAPLWSEVQAELDLITTSPPDVDKLVVDSNLKDTLQNILEVKAVAAKAVPLLITAKAHKELSGALDKLNDALMPLDVIARVQLRSIADQVDILVTWAKGVSTGQGGPTKLPKDLTDDLVNFNRALRESADSSKAILQNPRYKSRS